MKRECFIYARVSSDRQEREGFSIPAQLELLRGYAARNDMVIAGEYVEAESAHSSGRDQFEAMMKILFAAKKPMVVLAEKTDRFYRNFKDYVRAETLMNERDMELHLVKEGEVLSKTSSSHIKFIHGIKVLMAKNYCDNLSEEVRKGQRQKAMAGGWSWPAPYGYMNQNKEIIPHPEEAPLVRQAFKLYGTGLISLRDCATELARSGYHYRPGCKKIPFKSLQKLLENRIYIGDIVTNGEVFRGRHVPLVDLELWQKVQSALKRKAKPMSEAKLDFLYRGILHCGECGKLLVGEAKKQGRYHYYRCSAMKDGCTQGYVAETLLNKTVQGQLEAMRFSEEMRRDLMAAFRELDRAENNTREDEAQEIEREITRCRQYITQAYHDKLAGHIDNAFFLQVKREQHDRESGLLQRLEAVRKTEENYDKLAEMVLELPERIEAAWFRGDVLDRARLLNLVYSNFTVQNKEVSPELNPVFGFIYSWHTGDEWRSDLHKLRHFIRDNLFTIRSIMEHLAA